jgi:hypothetical protein
MIRNELGVSPHVAVKASRTQNLRFAHLLCGAQEMSMSFWLEARLQFEFGRR